MSPNRRQEKISSLIKQSLSRPLIDISQETFSCLTSITRLEMSKDLNTAYVYLSFFGNEEYHEILKKLEEKKGQLRKYIATHTKLKYNPQLIFLLDPSIAHEVKIDDLLDEISNYEKQSPNSHKK